MAYRLTRENHKVILAAADTFRAAAIDQLKVWGERIGVPVISQSPNSDPGAVVYDAIQAAMTRGMRYPDRRYCRASPYEIQSDGRVEEDQQSHSEVHSRWSA